MKDKDTKQLEKAYGKISEAMVQWDDIPFKIQRRIYRLEKQLDDLQFALKLGNKSKDVLDSIKNIKKEISRLERPYYK